MREIKFRAWDGEKMHHATLEDLIEAMGSQGAGSWLLHEEVGEELAAFAGRSYDSVLRTVARRTMTYMQYTGLHDRNGKEVYEGDIVKGDTHWGLNGGRPLTVAYELGTWNYSYDLIEFGQEPEKMWEVIGNIYENPELV